MKIPNRFDKIKVWFKRPGFASTFTPIEGILQEWITSPDVAKTRIGWLIGKHTLFLLFNNRKVSEVSMNTSNSALWVSTYS
jgi:hypothetical protein